MATYHPHVRTMAIGFRATLLGCLLLTGCGESSGTVRVTGRVTFDGRSPPAPCVVLFAPLDAAARVRPGSATCSSNGSFSANSFRAGDGLLPGRYKVSVRCIKDWGDENTLPTSFVPDGFVFPELTVGNTPPPPLQIDVSRATTGRSTP